MDGQNSNGYQNITNKFVIFLGGGYVVLEVLCVSKETSESKFTKSTIGRSISKIQCWIQSFSKIVRSILKDWRCCCKDDGEQCQIGRCGWRRYFWTSMFRRSATANTGRLGQFQISKFVWHCSSGSRHHHFSTIFEQCACWSCFGISYCYSLNKLKMLQDLPILQACQCSWYYIWLAF